MNTKEIIHVTRMQQEILFQLLIKRKSFENVTVKELKDFSTTAIAQINNYSYDFEQNKREELYTDEKFNQSTFITNQLMSK